MNDLDHNNRLYSTMNVNGLLFPSYQALAVMDSFLLLFTENIAT